MERRNRGAKGKITPAATTPTANQKNHNLRHSSAPSVMKGSSGFSQGWDTEPQPPEYPVSTAFVVWIPRKWKRCRTATLEVREGLCRRNETATKPNIPRKNGSRRLLVTVSGRGAFYREQIYSSSWYVRKVWKKIREGWIRLWRWEETRRWVEGTIATCPFRKGVHFPRTVTGARFFFPHTSSPHLFCLFEVISLAIRGRKIAYCTYPSFPNAPCIVKQCWRV